ncbi:CAP domain-containing protein [Metabacillus fastidiosus]|uniref:CAP domain-containing protein n=1 Tax=Metabacillus fastidiosus TaxID=1458 RepID=UPI002E2369FB|nr:CAP domain-containing protein [Metabacillus fastidiosus]
MKKGFIFSVAAAAVLFSSAGVNNADAATVEKKVYIYQSGNMNIDQLNNYLKNFQLKYSQPTLQKPVQVPTAQKQPVQQPATQVPEKTESASNTSQVSAFEQKVIDLTNQERAKQGLSPLKLDTKLSQIARTKSLDMKNKGYFSHTSPTYGSPFDMMKQFGISYTSAGENIAKGQRSPEEVVNAWMNSEGHRANILNSSYTHIGVGYVEDGNYWTQMFIKK